MKYLLALTFSIGASLAHAQQTIPMYLSGPIHIGTKPVNSGACPIGTQLGGLDAGSFVGSAVCTAVAGGLVLTFTNLAPNGWFCTIRDLSTPANATNQTSYTAATATFNASWAASDIVAYQCSGF